MGERFEAVSRLDSDRRALVDALIRAATLADGVSPVGEHKYLKLHAGSAVCSALLAFDDTELVGYGQVLLCDGFAAAEVVVHPASRRRGVGRRLIAEAGALAAASGARELRFWAYGALPAIQGIAAHRGLTPGRTLLQLERSLKALPSPPSLGACAVRQFDLARDRDRWLALHNEVFADHPENGKWSAEDLDARLAQPWFDPDDFLIAESAGEMVGFNWLKRLPDLGEGEIYVVGVAASQRGRGLGRALALLGLHHLRDRGMRVCTLFVEADNRPALRLYRALGFSVRHTHHCYALPLPAAAAGLLIPAEPAAVHLGAAAS